MENNYDITLFLLEQGINFNEPDNDGPHLKTPLKYSCNDQITELLKRFGAKFTLYNNPSLNFNSKGIDIKSNSNNIINDLYKQFLERGIISQKEEIKLSNGEIIAKRLLRNNKYKQERDTSSWIKVYHGTKLVSIEHILMLGLRSFGEPLYGHIPFGEKIFEIKNWAKGIFVTPSIFYSSKYADIINSENEQWYIIIEAKVAPNSFSVHEKTIYDYKFKEGETQNLEYRINAEEDLYGNGASETFDESNVETNSILFVKKKFLDNCRKYSDSSIIN